MKHRKWDWGSRMIIVAAIAAVLSLFFKWVEISMIAENGFGQGAYWFILLFLYPVLAVIREKRMNKLLGCSMAAAGIVLGLIYIFSKTADILGMTIHAAASGPYLFLAACGLLILGIYKRAN